MPWNVPPSWSCRESVPSSGGIYAPTLRFHDGRFFLVTTNMWGGGNLLFTATSPRGRGRTRSRIGRQLHVDPDLAWDDGRNLLSTVAGIEQARLDTATGALLEEPRTLWSGTLGHPEAPHLYEIDGTWYLMIAEGGTERGHCISIARGSSPEGPFAPCPANPILTHRSTTDPIQNTGHGDLVQATDGSWWLVFLGVRPKGGSPGYHALGRRPSSPRSPGKTGGRSWARSLTGRSGRNRSGRTSTRRSCIPAGSRPGPARR